MDHRGLARSAGAQEAWVSHRHDTTTRSTIADVGTTDPDATAKPKPRGLRERSLTALGFLFVALATAGVALPLLPTTPFLIVAAGCFARSSPRHRRWLLEHRLLGPFLRDWQATRSIPRRAKLVAIAVIAATGAGSLQALSGPWWAKLFLAVTLVAVATWIATRPAPPRNQTPGRDAA